MQHFNISQTDTPCVKLNQSTLEREVVLRRGFFLSLFFVQSNPKKQV